MARHHCMPPEEAGYTYAVEPTAIDRLLANEEESIYGRSDSSKYQTTLTPLISDTIIGSLFADHERCLVQVGARHRLNR